MIKCKPAMTILFLLGTVHAKLHSLSNVSFLSKMIVLFKTYLVVIASRLSDHLSSYLVFHTISLFFLLLSHTCSFLFTEPSHCFSYHVLWYSHFSFTNFILSYTLSYSISYLFASYIAYLLSSLFLLSFFLVILHWKIKKVVTF